MAKKHWMVTTDERTYEIDLKGSKITINGETMKLSRLARKTHFVDVEYTVPLGNRSATLLVQSLASPILAYEGKNCETGQPFEYPKIPVWGWVFLVLDIIACPLFGWLWGVLALVFTALVIRSDLNMLMKILLSVLLLIAAAAMGLMMGALLA